MVTPVTYSGTLTWELRNSRGWETVRTTDKMDRRVTDDDVTLGSHKSITQTNCTNEVTQKKMTSRPGMEMTK